MEYTFRGVTIGNRAMAGFHPCWVRSSFVVMVAATVVLVVVAIAALAVIVAIVCSRLSPSIGSNDTLLI